MEHSLILGDYSDSIEGALCLWDLKYLEALRDVDAAQVLEMLLDKHHFGDTAVACQEPKLLEGLEFVERAILRDLSELPRETLVKILSVVYFVLRRRGLRGREYFDVVRKYVGLPTGDGSYLRGSRFIDDNE